MTDPRAAELIAAATQVHDQSGCGCDPRYLMSCPRMATAILQAGQQQQRQPADQPEQSEPAALARIDAVDLAARWIDAAGIPVRTPDVAAWLTRLGIPVPAGIHTLMDEIRRAVIAAGDAGYAHAVTVLRDDDRYRAWWPSAGDEPARRHFADYLEAVGPAAFDSPPSPPAPAPTDGIAAARRRHALAFNALTRTLLDHGPFVPLSVREQCTRSVLAALDADNGGTR